MSCFSVSKGFIKFKESFILHISPHLFRTHIRHRGTVATCYGRVSDLSVKLVNNNKLIIRAIQNRRFHFRVHVEGLATPLSTGATQNISSSVKNSLRSSFL
ncbi:unnamed protein product [Tenebrio molitor]|nr:unnamed protein product [Tenebrio molitor]